VDSDQHCGSTLGLITPEGVEVDNGNWFKPGDALLHLWTEHQGYVDYASEIIKKWRKKGATTHYVNLGDLTDGDHHNTHQIVNRDQGTHIAAARHVLRDGFFRLDFDTIHFIMGTPAHVGAGGALEKSIASDLSNTYPIVRCPWNGLTVWPELTAQFGAYRFHLEHHGATGQRQHTEKSYAAIYAYDVHGSFLNDDRVPPDVAVRAHKHRMVDSGPDFRGITRAIQTGCWQYSSEWVRSRSIKTKPHLGGWIFVVTDDMRDSYDLWLRPFRGRHPQAPEEVWTPAA
jgi:hypothetical protein